MIKITFGLAQNELVPDTASCGGRTRDPCKHDLE